MTTITEKQDGKLFIINDGFFGGRLNREGDGFVSLEFEPYDPEAGDWHVIVADNMELVDGHYGPVSLSRDQLIEIRDWINNELETNSQESF